MTPEQNARHMAAHMVVPEHAEDPGAPGEWWMRSWVGERATPRWFVAAEDDQATDDPQGPWHVLLQTEWGVHGLGFPGFTSRTAAVTFLDTFVLGVERLDDAS